MGLLDLIEARRLERERAIRNEKALNAVKVIASIGVGFTLGILLPQNQVKRLEKIFLMQLKKD